MIEVIVVFALAFFFSFIGSIPPGTINLTIIKLGLEQRMNIAWKFAIASAIIEYPYAWLAIKFEEWITSSPLILDNLQLLTAIVMTLLGVVSLWPSDTPSALAEKFNKSGFRRGIVLSILNPLAIPYWLGITAYLKGQQWIDLSDTWELQSYLAGVTLGSLAILLAFAYLARKIASRFQQSILLKKLPGVMLLLLGLYAFAQYLL
ncbi:LysE family translocator [Ohtaekwangia koreensis]|uniref:Threonine/homoserine/homoserine lactone efflux protein n=1 Tax=Ohtaekwangia koreensis TaxID=688867 RepID=A0A1T5LJM2_9BACT|nr:LysE family transporter [Ohtaekwangia koreensis]SKC76170.1 Threonine/homoserine/homoserine lactone efflux protein [Ohtaekwangia koreensis]